MAEAFWFPTEQTCASVLLHPSAVPIIDVFRAIDGLEDHFDLALLEEPEKALATYLRPPSAKSVMADLLLLAFTLAQQQKRAFEHKPIGSRHASRDEYCLMAMIGAAHQCSLEVSKEASAMLSISCVNLLLPLAKKIAWHIDHGNVVFPVPTLCEFRNIVKAENEQRTAVSESSRKPDLHRGL